jgi:hypothetical protein
MTELLLIAFRGIGVVLPGAGLLGIVELRRGAPDGDFGTFLGAMALSLLAAAVWSAIDTYRAPTARVCTRWVATTVVVSAGLGLASAMTEPGISPGPALMAEAVSIALFYAVPLLVAAVLGVAMGAPGGR